MYGRKLAKERTKEDHLYVDKDKFVTNAYKKKLAEQPEWMEEERLRELCGEKEDVTKKSDLTDFYFNLGKDVAFDAQEQDSRKQEKQPENRKPEKQDNELAATTSDKGPSLEDAKLLMESSRMKTEHVAETSSHPERKTGPVDLKPFSDQPVSNTSEQEKPSTEQQ